MKILFESINGKKGTKEFASLNEAKSFVMKNKNVIKEAHITEWGFGGYENNEIKEKASKFVKSDVSVIRGAIMNIASKKNSEVEYWHYLYVANELVKYINERLDSKKDIKEAHITEWGFGGYENNEIKEKASKFVKSDVSVIRGAIMNIASKKGSEIEYWHYLYVANELAKYINERLDSKNDIEEAQIMEGPLGSGEWTPKKAWNQFKKGLEKMSNIRKTDKMRDSFDNNIFYCLGYIASDIGKDIGLKGLGVGIDKQGYYISSIMPVFKNFEDEDNTNVTKIVNSESEKYSREIYMPKLTKYIETHKSLPSCKQVREYMRKLIEKRYEQNLEK